MLESPEIKLKCDLKTDDVKSEEFREYIVGDLTMSVDAAGDHKTTVESAIARISVLDMDNERIFWMELYWPIVRIEDNTAIYINIATTRECIVTG